MRDLAFALFRMTAIILLFGWTVPSFSGYIGIIYTAASGEMGHGAIIAPYLASLAGSVLGPIALFFASRPLARMAVPDRELPGVTLDQSTAISIALLISAMMLAASASARLVAIVAEVGEWLRSNASNLDASHRIYWDSREWGAIGQLVAAALFVRLARRLS